MPARRGLQGHGSYFTCADAPDHRVGRQPIRRRRGRTGAPLVVQVLDGANRPVSGVPLTWTVTGGGTVTPPTSTTDNDGKATVTWTLSTAAGVQVVTVTSIADRPASRCRSWRTTARRSPARSLRPADCRSARASRERRRAPRDSRTQPTRRDAASHRRIASSSASTTRARRGVRGIDGRIVDGGGAPDAVAHAGHESRRSRSAIR